MSDERGWPQRSGYRRRTAQLVSALAVLGPVTWIVAPRNPADDGGPVEIPEHLEAHIETALIAAPTRSRAATAARWLTAGLPWPLAAGDWSAVVEALRHHRGLGHRFEVVWAMGVDPLLAIQQAGIDARVTVVDADLESLKLARRLAVGEPNLVRRTIARIDVSRWRRLERWAAEATNGFSVCNEDERRLLGGRAFVTPNSYASVDSDRQRTGEPSPATLLFIGSLGYEPNLDGLLWFADQVLPRIRRHDPSVSLRVVGSGLTDQHRLRSVDGIEVVGAVDDVGAELRRATGVVVPLRWGAGTRIKILEAFAHRVPVVSTSLGAEGLEVTSGRQLLLADDPEAFAEACSTVLAGGEAIAGVVDRAHETFASRYEEVAVSHRLVDRIRRLLDEGRPGHVAPAPFDTPGPGLQR